MTGTMNNREESLTVIGHIEGVPCPMVVDTGANITIVRPDVLTMQLRHSIQATTRVLKTATGETVTVHAQLKLKVKIGGAEVSHVALVADISDKFILGLDFLMAHGCSVDTEVGSLRIGAEEVPLHKPVVSQVARCHQVVAMEDTVISPYSETLVPAKLVGEPYGEPWGTVGPSPTTTLPPGVMVGKTLVNAQRDYIPVRMVNLTNEPRQIPSGIEVATCEPVESIVHPTSNPLSEPTSPDEGLPEHLNDLYLRSATGLTNDQQHQLHNLLLEFQDIFSRGPHDLGRTGVTKHKINTGDAPSVRQHPRRLPLAQREEAFKAVEEMHAQGIIEPSTSPWASPVVLVKKKRWWYQILC